MFKNEHLSRSNVIYILHIFLPGHVTLRPEPLIGKALNPKHIRSPFAQFGTHRVQIIYKNMSL